jgi:hypothetical protein
MIFLTKRKKLTIVSLCAVALLFLAYQITFSQVLYSPFGGVYINVTDCKKPYEGGQGSFSGTETRYGDTFTKVSNANWYVDEVELLAPSLWRVDGQIYDDAFLELQRNGYERTHRIMNDIDERTLALLVDDYYGDVGFTDIDTTYVIHGWGWGSFASLNKAGCFGYGSNFPTRNLTFPANRPKKDLLEVVAINLIEFREPFENLGNPVLDGFSSDYLFVNDSLYYQLEVTSPVINLGRLSSNSEIKRLYPQNGGSVYGDIVAADGKIFAGEKLIPGDPAEFSLITTGKKASGHTAYSDDFVLIGDDVYYIKRQIYSPLKLEKTAAVADSFQLYTGKIFTKGTVYTDGANYYIATRDEYRVVSVAEVDNNPEWGTVAEWLRKRTI